MTTTTRFTVTQAPVLASTYLGIQLPISMESLKKAFRKQTRKLHPDNPDTGNREVFQQMMEVYEFLVNIAHLPGIIGDMKPNGSSSRPIDWFITTDRTSIFDLGLGLGVTKNGKDCRRCEHNGYTITQTFGYTTCTDCDVRGEMPYVQTLRCKSCIGTGKFRQKNTGRIVNCLTCGGTGQFTTAIPGRCATCGGSKRVYGPTGEETYQKCFECRGTGEIEIDNPVIAKGRLF